MNNLHLRSKGFSLIEVAVVLVIVGLLTGGALTAYSRWVEKQLYEQVVSDIELAKKAIVGFALTNSYLPCSDISTNTAIGDGKEDRVIGASFSDCETNASLVGSEFRSLPFADLGINGIDPWGNVYRYHVHEDYAQATAAGVGTLLLNNANGLTVDDGTGTEVANNVAFVVYSLGPDEGRVFTLQQNENLDLGGAGYNNTFSKASTYLPFDEKVVADPTDDEGFDDVISWESTHVIKYKLLEAELLP